MQNSPFISWRRVWRAGRPAPALPARAVLDKVEPASPIMSADCDGLRHPWASALLWLLREQTRHRLKLVIGSSHLAAPGAQMAELFKIAEARGEKHANAIFFHGLGGDAHTTWEADKEDKTSFWLPWLTQDIEGLSVYSVGYEAPVSDWHGSAMELADRAANVLNLLLVKTDLGEGELILAGHSLGGLVIKQLLRKAADAATDCAGALSFIDRVRKVAFLATPHAGADLARSGDRLRVFSRPSAATRSLLRNDSHLRDLNLWYRRWAQQRGIDHLILTETKTTSMFGMIVKPDSSDPDLASDPIPTMPANLPCVRELDIFHDDTPRVIREGYRQRAQCA